MTLPFDMPAAGPGLSTGRQTSRNAKNGRELPRRAFPDQSRYLRKTACWLHTQCEISLSYEGTNQIKRMVLARSLRKG